MSAQPASQFAPGVKTLVFDVLGTVVDEAGSIRADTVAALTAAGADAEAARALAAGWLASMDELLGEVRAAGPAGWQPNSAVRREALAVAVQRSGLPALPGEVLDNLALAGHRLRPWPDSAAALGLLAESFTVVALSNATFAELASMSAHGGLSWHCVLSAELAHAYKPDPAVYRMALDLLALEPQQTMMVAAHPWDLRAAAQHGMRSAFIARPGEGVPGPGDTFDLCVRDLADLAVALTLR